jgi:protein-S-isoprenylcysteine O-methyltransferase Ste14
MTRFVLATWAAFWLYWLIAAATANASTGTRPGRGAPGLIIVVFIVLRVLRGDDTAIVHSVPVQIVGLVLFVSGLALAVWARICLGRNWGMPMSQRAEPELVTSGPYRLVRHPIYSGILLAVLGSALCTSLFWLVALALLGAYFIYSARVEERTMTGTFPSQYPGYMARTKMLIPFVL